jgi:hypothetical protein
MKHLQKQNYKSFRNNSIKFYNIYIYLISELIMTEDLLSTLLQIWEEESLNVNSQDSYTD